jgi:mono/diheme cytochrome c family protein
MRPRSLVTSALVLALLPTAAWADEAVDFRRDVQPLLAAHCVKCHGPRMQESGLRLDAGRLVLQGGSTGPAVVAGKSDESLLIQVVTDTSDEISGMPPEGEGEPLTPEQIALLRRWIDQGAKVPSDETIADDPRRSGHWAFQPIRRPDLPDYVADEGLSSAASRAIDVLVRARLVAEGLAPSPPADRVVLLRRVSIDLIGLPPSLDEIETYLADDRPDAYERVVDRLLASPHFGERWGRHWLDLARYADSDGYTNDDPREMWTYRDWVIDAVNADMPFDQFTIEQLAGDLLPDATVAQRIATGFHRNTQFNTEGGSDPEQYRVEAVVDRVATTGSVFLGLTLGCARCHDHKFDPITQRDFFAIYALLNNQDEPKIKVPTSTGSGEATALVLAERSKPRETFLHIRGDFLRPGTLVEPGAPGALPPLSGAQQRPNRLDFARWLVSPDHPLTPRVTANRVWQHLFGRGLVETENDFGLQGTAPSHPELLDWLAAELVEGGWSIKHLVRQIALSETYRQSSRRRPELDRVDPQNRLLGRQNRLRLEAEIVRDAALESSGLLSHKLKGPSVFPPQPDGVMLLTRNPGRRWVVSPGEDRYRRGMYTHFWRSTPHPFLKVFNAPESNTTCTRRDRANTPLQALTLLNDEMFMEAAYALAVRVLTDGALADDRAKIEHLWRLVLSREPTSFELAALAELLAAERADVEDAGDLPKFAPLSRLPADFDRAELVAWTSLARVVLNLDEFITRE